MFKKNQSTILSTSLILIVIIIAISSYQNWLTHYSVDIFLNTETKSNSNIDNSLRIEGLINNILYLKSGNEQNLNYLRIQDETGKVLCDYNPDKLINHTGLLGCWNFNEYNTSGVFDASGNGHFGYFRGGLSPNDIVTGIKGKGNGIHLDGKDDYIEIPHDEVFDNLEEMTIEVWMIYEGTRAFSDPFRSNINEIGFIYNDNGTEVVKVNASEGAGYVYLKNFTNLDGGLKIYERSKILNNSGDVNIYQFKILDLTNGSIISNKTITTNEYLLNNTYYFGYQNDNAVNLFGEEGHTYQLSIYSYGVRDLFFDYFRFENTHRSVLSKSIEQDFEWCFYNNLDTSGAFQFVTNSNAFLPYFHISRYHNYKDYVYLVSTFNKNSNNNLTLYTNSNLSETTITDGLNKDINAKIILGKKFENTEGLPNAIFKGKIDEIKIWNRTLSQEEIQKTYLQAIKELSPGINQIDLKDCNLEENKIYDILAFTDNSKVEGKIIAK